MSATEFPPLLTLAILAQALGTTTSGARRLVLREGIPHVHLGKRIVVRRGDFEGWLEAHLVRSAPRVAPPPAPVAPEWARDLLNRGRRPGLSAQEARDAHAARNGKG